MIVELPGGRIKDLTVETIICDIKLPESKDGFVSPEVLPLISSESVVSNRAYLDLTKKNPFMSTEHSFDVHRLLLTCSVKSKKPDSLERLLQRSYLEFIIGEKTQVRDELATRINIFDHQGEYFQSSQGFTYVQHKGIGLALNQGQSFQAFLKRNSEICFSECEYSIQLSISGKLMSNVM